MRVHLGLTSRSSFISKIFRPTELFPLISKELAHEKTLELIDLIRMDIVKEKERCGERGITKEWLGSMFKTWLS